MNIAFSMEHNKRTSVGDTVKRYGRQLFSFIKGRTRTDEDAEDILQEVWYQLSRLTNIEDLENVTAWLYSVSRNKITDLYRKKKPDSLEDYARENEDGEFEIKDILLLDDSQGPELAMFRDLFWKELMTGLQELPENQKQVFIQNELEDKTLQQIADEQGENIKTIISRKGYATSYLRKKLRPLYNDIINR